MERNDKTTAIAELTIIIKEFRAARGWQDYNDPYDLAAALSVEASEILELLLWGKDQDFKKLIATDPKLKEKIGEEIADVFSYLLILSDAIGIDITASFFNKIAKNAEKYPVLVDGMTPRRKRWLE